MLLHPAELSLSCKVDSEHLPRSAAVRLYNYCKVQHVCRTGHMRPACLPCHLPVLLTGKPHQQVGEVGVSSQELEGADDDSDDDQAVKVLNPFRADSQDLDPAFEEELAALTRQQRQAGSQHVAAAGAGAPSSSASLPAADASSAGVAFHVVLRKAGNREGHSKLIQVRGSASSALFVALTCGGAASCGQMQPMMLSVMPYIRLPSNLPQ